MQGSLIGETKDMGILDFISLIGMYFKKHNSAMVSLKYVETPQQPFNSKPCTSADEQHRLWYDIRTIIGDNHH